MAIHPTRDIIATGQMAAKGKAKVVDIFVWNASTMENLAQINGFHRRAVRNLAFSPNGEKLLSIGEDDFHSVAIYDWRAKKRHFADKSNKNKVFACCFRDDNTAVTCGSRHIYFWNLRRKEKKKGLFGRAPGVKLQPLLALAPLAGGAQIASGTAR